jgi:vancomycin resistance protein YoaR
LRYTTFAIITSLVTFTFYTTIFPLFWPTACYALKGQSIPWESTQEFRQAVSKADTPIRMAFYKATLKEPLPGELFNISHAANLLAGTVVKQDEIFSQNQTLGPYTRDKGYQKGPTYSGSRIITTTGGGVCKIASLLYNIATLSNLQIVERHNHSLTVPYVPPGQDATVSYGYYDIKFKNTTNGPVLIWAKTYDKTLWMAIYGRQLPPIVTWYHETLKTTKATTLRRVNPQLPSGTEKEFAPGQNGMLVRTWLTIRYSDGQVETKDLGKDYYSPSPRIIEQRS